MTDLPRRKCYVCNGTGRIELRTSRWPGMKFLMAPSGFCRTCDGTGWIVVTRLWKDVLDG